MISNVFTCTYLPNRSVRTLCKRKRRGGGKKVFNCVLNKQHYLVVKVNEGMHEHDFRVNGKKITLFDRLDFCLDFAVNISYVQTGKKYSFLF